MMPMGRTNRRATERFAERRRREEDAPKLRTRVPELASLRFEIEERCGSGGIKYIRRFIVERAPALFVVPCGDPRCADGEHDLTTSVMQALYAHQTSFRGSDDCTGSLGTSGSACLRVLHFEATAEYRP